MDPNQYIKYLRIFGRVTLTWPPDPKISRSWLAFNTLMWLIIFLFNIIAIVCLTGRIVQEIKDPEDLSTTSYIISIRMDCFLQMILVTIHWPRFQILTHEVTEFMRCAKFNEKIVYQKYIKRYLGYQCVYGSVVIGGTLINGSGWLTTGKRFPVEAWYPFSTDPLGARIFVYVLQFSMILQTIVYLTYDYMVTMIVSYSTARFELLSEDFRKVKNPLQFRDCVEKHKKMLRFVKETERAISLVILKVLGFGIIVITAAALRLSDFHNFATLSLSFTVTLGAALKFFAYAWISDDLTDMAESLSWAMYQPSAFGKSSNLRKNMLIVMQMSQRSIAFNLWGTRTKLSLNLFGQYVLNVFSFYMTMRVVVGRYI